MSELEQAIKQIVTENLNAASVQALETGIDPGIILGSIIATAVATLRSFGVTREKIDELVTMGEAAAAKLNLAHAIPAGNA